MHELTVIIVLLLIIGIILDGIRRMRQARRNSSRMNLGVHQGATREDDQAYGSELPNGGARIADCKQEENAEYLNHASYKAIEANSSQVSKPYPTEKGALNLEESVPMLMDSVASNPKYAPSKTDRSHEEESNRDIHDESNQIIQSEIVESDGQERPSESIVGVGPNDYLDSPKNKRVEPKLEQVPDIGEEPIREPQLLNKKTSAPKLRDQPEELLVLHVEAANDEYFRGQDLLKLILDQGLRYGAMHIFHRHANQDGEGAILFSMTNMIIPGTFDLATIETLSIPGVSLFLSLPMADYNNMDAFESMLITAKTIANELNGQINDDQHNVMTRQITEHYRERIGDFSRKQRLLERA